MVTFGDLRADEAGARMRFVASAWVLGGACLVLGCSSKEHPPVYVAPEDPGTTHVLPGRDAGSNDAGNDDAGNDDAGNDDSGAIVGGGGGGGDGTFGGQG